MADFINVLREYGADVEGTLERFMGDKGLYNQCLYMLFDDENFNKLLDATNSLDVSGAFSAAHALKGAVANLGLTPLFNSISALVEVLRPGGFVDFKEYSDKVFSDFNELKNLFE